MQGDELDVPVLDSLKRESAKVSSLMHEDPKRYTTTNMLLKPRDARVEKLLGTNRPR